MGGEDDSRTGQRPHRVLYGRRTGRPLSRARRALVETLLPRLDIDLPDGRFDPAALFSFDPREVWLEIGFGGGEHLAAQARANPDVGLIGCEPFIDGVARLLADVEAGRLRNIRLFRDDARLLLDRLADDTLARAFILFPDPWPKLRHHKRRIVAPGPLRSLARVLRDGAELRIATDDSGYKEWILHHVLADGAFRWTARGPADWRTRPADWPATRYEAKAVAAGRRPAYFAFRRGHGQRAGVVTTPQRA
jgi:tRNA (guanine-N7-)-methyltransferase